MQVLNKADDAHTVELQGLIPTHLTARDRAARRYVIDAFHGKMSSLIPFALNNESLLTLASYLLKYTTGSTATLYQYTFCVNRFSRWIGKAPDAIIKEIRLDTQAKDRYIHIIDAFIGDLQAEHLAPGTIANHVKGVKALFRANDIEFVFPHRLPRRVVYHDRAPTPDELTKIIDIANLREKVIITMIALGSFRLGTLSKLQYRHVRKDLEAGIVPIHIHVDAEITKGKYHDYDTFIGREAVDYLKTYLNIRKQGTRRDRWGMPPEELHDASPLIRNSQSKKVKPVTPNSIHLAIHKLFIKTGLIEKGTRKRYELLTLHTDTKTERLDI
jgi:hypothetical protein